VNGPVIIVLMGVSGSGKTTVGKVLAAELGWSFYEGDDFHSAASVEKMGRGIALTDEDRRPWLAALRALIERCLEKQENAVLACSALKQAYRQVLRGDDAHVVFVYLEAPPELLAARLEHRAGHYAKRDLLPSQLATLEEPRDAVVVDASAAPEEIVGVIRARLGI
jgi:gluconokinase